MKGARARPFKTSSSRFSGSPAAASPVSRSQSSVSAKERGFIDLFWKGVLLVEQKSAGRDLVRAKEQALDYFPGLKEHELPRYLLVSDFQTFELYDLEDDTLVRFHLRRPARAM